MVASLSAGRLHDNGQLRDFAVVTSGSSDKNVFASIETSGMLGSSWVGFCKVLIKG